MTNALNKSVLHNEASFKAFCIQGQVHTYHAATKGILRLKAPSPLPVYENNAYGRKKRSKCRHNKGL